MTGDKLQSLKDMPVPPPSEAARASALAAAVAAFDSAGKENDAGPQENAAPARLTHASPQTQRRRSMRANYFQYKIAASIAVLVFAVPTALYLYKQDMGAGTSALREAKPVVKQDTALAAGGKTFPDGTRAIYERLTPDGNARVATGSGPAGQTSAASPAFAVAGKGRSLEDRIDEALKREQSASSAPEGDNQPTVVRSETYGPNGKPVNSRPVVTPGIGNAGGGQPYPNAAAKAPAPVSPPPAVLYNPAPSSGAAAQQSAFGYALLKEQFDQTQKFRFGAAP
jgi:hypothetical protein